MNNPFEAKKKEEKVEEKKPEQAPAENSVPEKKMSPFVIA